MEYNLPKLYVASNIEYLRKKKNMTQLQLGNLLDKDYTTIGKWEKNINQPSLEDTFKLAIIFGTDWKRFVLDNLADPNTIADEINVKGVYLTITTKLSSDIVLEVTSELITRLNESKKNDSNN